MIDLTQIDEATRLARGDYSTVRAAHEDEKKNLQMLCGLLSSTAAQVLRRMQPDNDDVPASVEQLLADGRKTLDAIELSTQRIEALARQRAVLKPQAWGKKP